MIRRQFFCCAAMVLSGCTQVPTGVNDTDSLEDSKEDTSPEPIERMDFTTSPADPPPPTAGPAVTTDAEERQLSVRATVQIPNSCHELALGTVTATSDAVSVVVDSEDTSDEDVNCSSETAYASYSLDVQLDESLAALPERLQLEHPIDETVHELY